MSLMAFFLISFTLKPHALRFASSSLCFVLHVLSFKVECWGIIICVCHAKKSCFIVPCPFIVCQGGITCACYYKLQWHLVINWCSILLLCCYNLLWFVDVSYCNFQPPTSPIPLVVVSFWCCKLLWANVSLCTPTLWLCICKSWSVEGSNLDVNLYLANLLLFLFLK
jgi:hypothetical protein